MIFISHRGYSEAQKLAAEAFGADYTFFSVQGTSGAIMTMILSVCSHGDKIIVPRNVQKSGHCRLSSSLALKSGFHLAGDGHELGIATALRPSCRKRWSVHPDAEKVARSSTRLITASARDLKEIVDLAHATIFRCSWTKRMACIDAFLHDELTVIGHAGRRRHGGHQRA